MSEKIRTQTCGELRREHLDGEVALAGWVQSVRDHGGVLFADLRDRYGVTQVVFNPERSAELHRQAEELRPEYVIRVAGKVQMRPEGTINPNIPTGEIEVPADSLEVLSKSETPPFEIDREAFVSEERRLEYRYLDMRRGPMLRNMIFRDKVFTVIRNYFHRRGFVEVETPMLTKSTPEGARDYIVPSRVFPGEFYALPQSPQLFKQLLMVGGLDRYFQIVKCFRDEDLRADRQPEFTQLDLEMAFAEEEDIIEVTEGFISEVFREALGLELETPFLRMSHQEAMEKYGCDKPDLRYGMELTDIADVASQCDFKVFRSALESGGRVKGICVPGGGEMSRADIDKLTDLTRETGAKGLALFKVADGALTSQIAKFFDESQQKAIIDKFAASEGDLLLFIADSPRQTARTLNFLRTHLAEKRNMIPKGEFRFCWVLDFPWLEYNEDEERYEPSHHPFTGIHKDDMDKIDSDPASIRAKHYDIVMNGVELGSGSIRIHDPELQHKVFSMLEMEDEEVEARFGFFLKGLRYGAPPHGGIAYGLDRFVQILLGVESIREVIAFPKTQKAFCPLTEAPSKIDDKQLRELGIMLRKKE